MAISCNQILKSAPSMPTQNYNRTEQFSKGKNRYATRSSESLQRSVL